jgi:hypothetical protein
MDKGRKMREIARTGLVEGWTVCPVGTCDGAGVEVTNDNSKDWRGTLKLLFSVGLGVTMVSWTRSVESFVKASVILFSLRFELRASAMRVARSRQASKVDATPPHDLA